MSNEYTPSLSKIKAEYTKRGLPPYTRGRGAEFDRAIARIKAETKVEALRELADDLAGLANIHSASSAWFTVDNIRARADKLEEQA